MVDRLDVSRDFSDCYLSARTRFLELASRLECEVASQEIAARGPNGEPLFIDVATRAGSGGDSPWQTVIVSGGLHGVEGFFGSAVQCAALDWLYREQPASLPRLVFVHALNPFGFAWIRRCNEDNVDLNRNFQPNAECYRGSPDGYARFDPLLNPQSPPRIWEPFRILGLAAIARYGTPMLRRAIATGQYEYPRGLFYGGDGPCQTTRFVEEEFPKWLGADHGPVLHLDLHTGLGRPAEFQFLSDLPPSKESAERVARILDREIQAGSQSHSVAYNARGSIGEWCVMHAGGRDYTYLCVEFGTKSPLTMLTALRAENRAQHWDQPGAPTYRWAKQLLKDAFCPRALRWRESALSQGLALFQRAVGHHQPSS